MGPRQEVNLAERVAGLLYEASVSGVRGATKGEDNDPKDPNFLEFNGDLMGFKRIEWDLRGLNGI